MRITNILQDIYKKKSSLPLRNKQVTGTTAGLYNIDKSPESASLYIRSKTMSVNDVS